MRCQIDALVRRVPLALCCLGLAWAPGAALAERGPSGASGVEPAAVEPNTPVLPELPEAPDDWREPAVPDWSRTHFRPTTLTGVLELVDLDKPGRRPRAALHANFGYVRLELDTDPRALAELSGSTLTLRGFLVRDDDGIPMLVVMGLRARLAEDAPALARSMRHA